MAVADQEARPGDVMGFHLSVLPKGLRLRQQHWAHGESLRPVGLVPPGGRGQGGSSLGAPAQEEQKDCHLRGSAFS